MKLETFTNFGNFLFILSTICTFTRANSSKGQKCSVITIPMCKGIGFNYTQMPNSFNHESQEEAGLEVHQYWPLVEIKCSSDLRFFICSLYTPICMEDYKGSVPPCRSVCLRAKDGCEPVMNHYGFQWPARFQCSLFPIFGPRSICMDERKGELPASTTSKPVLLSGATPNLFPNTSSNSKGTFTKKKPCSCSCKRPLVPARAQDRTLDPQDPGNYIYGLKIPNCSLPCQLYPAESNFANLWLGFWSSLCLFVAIGTVATAVVDYGGRFNYPERPIVYLSICYIFIASGFLNRVYKGHEKVSCEGTGTAKEVSLLSSFSSQKDKDCFLTFILIWYFQLAAKCWWVSLSTCWYLASALKWGSEAISKKWKWFHFLSWVGVPGVVGAITTWWVGGLEGVRIGGDGVSGVCRLLHTHTGEMREEEDWVWLLVTLGPEGILLCVGSWFLVGGFVELFRIRKVISKQHQTLLQSNLGGQGGTTLTTNSSSSRTAILSSSTSSTKTITTKLEKLIIRIFVFSILYTFPAFGVLTTEIYEQRQMAGWVRGISCGGSCGETFPEKPVYGIVMIKYFLTLAVGITTGGVWVWSKKTVGSWGEFFCLRKGRGKGSGSLRDGGDEGEEESCIGRGNVRKDMKIDKKKAGSVTNTNANTNANSGWGHINKGGVVHV